MYKVMESNMKSAIPIKEGFYNKASAYTYAMDCAINERDRLNKDNPIYYIIETNRGRIIVATIDGNKGVKMYYPLMQ